MSFVHLHNHTHYSLLDAVLKPHELVEAAKEAGQTAVALTDHGVMFGIVEFFKACKEKGVKPIIGIEAYIANGSRFEKPKTVKGVKQRNYYHIVLLAKNDIGYHNLLKLTSLGFTEGFYHRPRIDKEILEKYHEGIICSTACLGGIVNGDIIDGNIEKAYQEARYYKNLFGEDFYMEIQRHGYEQDELLISEVTKIAKEINSKIICTNDIHYLKKEHAIAHNVLLNISSSKKGIDYKKLRYQTAEFYFKTTEEMATLFSDYPEALTNTLEVAEKCKFELELNVLHMPQYPIPENSNAKDLDEYLKELTYKMMEKTRLKGKPLSDEYRERIEYELSIIKQMGFPGYFLITQDFINEAKNRGVPVGPGRGSAAGSLVAYALGITNIDPIRFNLLFERFLNPERVSMPDIDIDFCDEKRGIVLEYVKEKYGEDAVAQIVTFSKLTMKACVQDVGRVLEIPLDEVRKITAAIPDKGTKFGDVKVKNLAAAYEHVPDLQYLKDKAKKEPIFQELIDITLVLENTNRGRGTHAAGVIIAPGPVSDFVPICTPIGSQKDSESLGCDIVTQFQNSSGEVEQCGLLKMDFLGLRTLSIIERTLDMIEKNHGIKINLDEIPLDDKETFELLSRGETQAIFQFESSGMQEYLKQLKPHSIEELTAMNALYRPGPMDNIPEFIDVKYEKREMNCYHDDLKPFLTETYGVIVYQEQVMQIGQKLAGFTLGGADVMRRIMGKKKPDAMKKLEPEFKGGFEKQGYSQKLADLLWEVLLPFCNYGFNKSHAVAYSYVAYQTAYLKTHYPAEFIASNMTALMNTQDQVVALIDEAKRYGISIKPPNVNISGAYFEAPNDKEIYYGLAGIRNVGIPIVEEIIKGRKDEKYHTFFDFIARSDKKVQNKRAVEALVCAGVFDTLHNGQRRPLFESIEDAINYAKAVEKSNANATESLFGAMEESKIPEPPLPKMEDWNIQTKLKNEKEFLNFYLTGHPLDAYKSIIEQFNPITIEQLPKLENGTDLKLFGLLSSITVKSSNRDQSKFAVLVLEDFKDKIECVMWSDAYEAVHHKLELDAAVMISGSLRKKNDSVSVTVEDLYTLDNLIGKHLKGYQIFLNVDNGAKERLNLFKNNVTTKIGDDKEVVFSLYSTKDREYRKNYEISTYFSSTLEKFRQIQEIFDPEEKGNVKLNFRMPEFRQAKKRRFNKRD